MVAELTDHVEGLARRLLEREPQLVRLNGALDFGAHVSSRFEKAVRGYESVECLMRTLKVVVADVMVEAALRVDDMREYGAPEKLVPQRLPEPFDLAQRLRMLGSTADVLHAHAREQLFKLRLAPPYRVLTAVVGQHFGGLSVRGDAALERLHDER